MTPTARNMHTLSGTCAPTLAASSEALAERCAAVTLLTADATREEKADSAEGAAGSSVSSNVSHFL